MKGIDYVPKDAEQVKIEMQAKAQIDEQIEVKMWRMETGKYTQVEVTYHGEKIYLVVSPGAPADDPLELEAAATRFFKFYDIGKTRILGKAQSTVTPPATGTKTKLKTRSYNGSKRCGSDAGMTAIGKENNNAIYKERVVQVFKYARTRSKDMTLTETEREWFDTNDVLREVFVPAYEQQSPTTVRNKATSTLRHMVKNEWLETQRFNPATLARYRVLKNPFESDMPPEPEFDADYAKESRMKEIEMYRQT